MFSAETLVERPEFPYKLVNRPRNALLLKAFYHGGLLLQLFGDFGADGGPSDSLDRRRFFRVISSSAPFYVSKTS